MTKEPRRFRLGSETTNVTKVPNDQNVNKIQVQKKESSAALRAASFFLF